MRKTVLVSREANSDQYGRSYNVGYTFLGGGFVTVEEFIRWKADTGFEIKENPRIGKNGSILSFADEMEYKLFCLKFGVKP